MQDKNCPPKRSSPRDKVLERIENLKEKNDSSYPLSPMIDKILNSPSNMTFKQHKELLKCGYFNPANKQNRIYLYTRGK